MIQLETQERTERIKQAIEDREPARVVSFSLGGEEYASRFEGGTIEHPKDGVAMVLDTTLAGSLPGRLENASINIRVEMGGILLPRFVGYLSSARKTGGRVEVRAGSLGSYLPDVALGSFFQTLNEPAAHVVRRGVVGRLPYANVSVEESTVTITRMGEDGFERIASVADLLSVVSEQSNLVFFDDVFRGFRGVLNPGTGEGRPVVWRYHENDPGVEWTPPKGERARYTHVEVYRQNENGTDAFVPQRAAVNFTGIGFRPPVESVKYVPFDDTSPDVQRKARELANQLAARETAVVGDHTLVVPYNPLLEKTDVVVVTDEEEGDGGYTERHWACVVWNPKEVLAHRHELTGTAILLSDEFHPVRERVELGVSVGVASPPVGLDAADDLYFDTDGPGYGVWYGLDENGYLWIDPDLSGGFALVDANSDLQIEVA